jgi:hypothetical protein
VWPTGSSDRQTGAAPVITHEARYPILGYQPDQGSNVLWDHEPTTVEEELFEAMQAEVFKLPEWASMQDAHKVIIPVGKKAGLSPQQSIAFWTRMYICEFEE